MIAINMPITYPTRNLAISAIFPAFPRRTSLSRFPSLSFSLYLSLLYLSPVVTLGRRFTINLSDKLAL